MKNTNENAGKHVNILGINILSTNTDELLTGIEEKITHSARFSILTPNPELVLASIKNLELKDALNSATLAVPDGVGLAQAAKYLSLKAPKNILLRIPVTFVQGLAVGVATFLNQKWLTSELKLIKGRVLFEKLIALANKKGWKVFLLGGLNNEAELVAHKYNIPDSRFQIQFAGGSEVIPKLHKDIVDKINKFNPDLLFVAFGNPNQETFIYENLNKLNVRGMMAVGGTFRYIAGLSPLPPKWMAMMGLEWLYRLFTEPKRLGRVLNAFPIFPLRVFWFKITGR